MQNAWTAKMCSVPGDNATDCPISMHYAIDPFFGTRKISIAVCHSARAVSLHIIIAFN